MDDMAAYYPPPAYPYYQQPPPPPPPSQPPLAAVPPPPSASVSQPQQFYHHQQPHFVTYDHPAPPPTLTHYIQGFPNEVRTLFIAGLPEDVMPREIYNLFREFPGYESSHLRTPTETSQVIYMIPFSLFVLMHELD